MGQTKDSVQLVQVIYEAIEDDWWSADDHIRRQGTGVLFEDAEGRLLVLTARSVCDANYFERDTFGADPDIKNERITVVLVDGSVIRAMRTWAAPDDADLALLTLEVALGEREGIALTSPQLFAFEGDGRLNGQQKLMSLDPERRPVETQAPGSADAAIEPGLLGAPVLQDGRVVGVYGQSSGTEETAAIAPLSLLPEPLRPRS